MGAAALAWMLASRPRTLRRWIVDTALGASLVALVFQVGSWSFTSFYLRYALCGALVLVAAWTYRRLKRGGDRERIGAPGAVLVVVVALDAWAAASHLVPRESIAASFPLRSGMYYVLQGGNSAITNALHAIVGSPLALDITKLNRFGNRAGGVAPDALTDYPVFGETVHAPCTGTVLAAKGDGPDNPPGSSGPPENANFVKLRCGDAEVLVVHLMQGSVAVAAGAAVAARQPLGKVGNSGYSLEPHLHIGATRAGRHIGIVFEGRWLTMNSLVRIEDR